MKLAYVDNIPLKNYKRYKEIRDIELSDDLKIKFNNYYKEIEESSDLKVDEWTKKAGELKGLVESEISKKGNNKSIYVKDYIEFIFGVSYLLFDKFKLSQAKVSDILYINTSKFSKLGIFPYRCYNAYTKLDDKEKRRSLKHDDTDSVGIHIAECINKKIQAVYACSAFIGVSNDLDVFANIVSTDDKLYVLMQPDTLSEEKIVECCMAYPRFLFATANVFENVAGCYVAGKVKKEIVRLLKMRDDSFSVYNEKFKKMLDDGTEFEKYIPSNNKNFIYNVDKYRELKAITKSIEDDSYFADELVYDSDKRKRLGLDNVGFELTNTDRLNDFAQEKAEKIAKMILPKMSYAGVSKFDNDDFMNYKFSMLSMLLDKSSLFMQYSGGSYSIFDTNEKVRYAAVFWILSNLYKEITTENERDSALNYLKTNKLLAYIDSMHKEVKKGATHIILEKDNFDIRGKIDSFKKDSVINPVLVYVDSKDYKLTSNVIQDILKKNVILVIRQDLNDEGGIKFNELDKSLKLYYLEGRNEG
jgi:hypothetical protein